MALWYVLRDSIQELRYKGYIYIWANIAFVIACLPFVTIPTAWSALICVAHTAHNDPSEANLSLFWEAFKAQWKTATLWGVPFMLFGVMNFTNLVMQGQHEGNLGLAARLIFGGVGVVWLGMLLYTWAIYYKMDTPNIWQASRNALVMVVLNPFVTFSLIGIVGVLAVLSSILVGMWFLLTVSIIAVLSISSVHHLVKRHYTV